jgi:hypothetical protein
VGKKYCGDINLIVLAQAGFCVKGDQPSSSIAVRNFLDSFVTVDHLWNGFYYEMVIWWIGRLFDQVNR